MGMRMMRAFLIANILLLSLTSVVRALQGNAVFYSPDRITHTYTPSACYGSQDNGKMVAGVSDQLWNNRAACGKRYRVRCTGGANNAPHPCKDNTSVEVKIIDYCKAGCQGIINLSEDAFSVIADTNAGIIQVELNEV